MALIGPFAESPGSAARRIMVHSTDSEPQCSYNGTNVLERPVVLHDTTRVPWTFMFSMWLAEEVYDIPVMACFSPPWKIYFTPAARYFSLFDAPTLPGEQSTTTSAIARRSESPTIALVTTSSKSGDLSLVSHRYEYKGYPFLTARSQPKDGRVLVTPIISMSSWASTASATTLSDGSVSVDGYLDAHDPLHALLIEALNKHFFADRVQIHDKPSSRERLF